MQGHSSTPWLAEVPSHWSVAPLGVHTRLVVPMRDKPERLDGSIPWVRIEDFDGAYLSRSKSGQGVDLATVRKMNLKVFPRGTVLCSCSCSMGATAIASDPLVSNQTFIGIVPAAGLSSKYLYYLMATARQELTARASGAIQQYLSRNDFSRLRVPLPSLDTQERIAAYLDRKTAAIDQLIQKKERLIELLQRRSGTLSSPRP
jgi:type I restriction enzyme S subunit